MNPMIRESLRQLSPPQNSHDLFPLLWEEGTVPPPHPLLFIPHFLFLKFFYFCLDFFEVRSLDLQPPLRAPSFVAALRSTFQHPSLLGMGYMCHQLFWSLEIDLLSTSDPPEILDLDLDFKNTRSWWFFPDRTKCYLLRCYASASQSLKLPHKLDRTYCPN